MRISDQKLDPKTKKEISALLYQVTADLKNPKEAESFLNDLLSKAEMISLAKRLAAAYYLEKGLGYDEIKNRLKLSSATIATIDKQIKPSAGFGLALKKISTEQWAGEWEKRIKNLFK